MTLKNSVVILYPSGGFVYHKIKEWLQFLDQFHMNRLQDFAILCNSQSKKFMVSRNIHGGEKYVYRERT